MPGESAEGAEAAEAAESAADRVREALEGARGKGGKGKEHAGHGGKGHAKPAGGGHEKPAAAGHEHAHAAAPHAEGHHEGTAPPQKGPNEAKPKRTGGGGDRPRDEHGRFASKSFEGDFGAPLPAYDQATTEQEDMTLGREEKSDDGAFAAQAEHPFGNPRPFADNLFESPDDESSVIARDGELPPAALCIVRGDDGRILCVSRPEPPHELSIPGGLIDPGERADQAAVRELVEECAIRVTSLHQVATITSPTDGRSVEVFEADAWEGTAVAAEPNTTIGWLTPQELLAQAQLYRASVRELMSAGLLDPPPPFPIDVAAKRLCAACAPPNPFDTLVKIYDRRVGLRKDGPGYAVTYARIPLIIDRPKGYVQRGQAPDGTLWERVYQYDYGYIERTCGGDGEGLDVYVGPDDCAPMALVVAQLTFEGGFDEYKIMLGFPGPEAAAQAYLAHTPAELFGYAFAVDVGFLRGLLGLEPFAMDPPVITMRAVEAVIMATTKKGQMPAGPSGEPNGDEDADIENVPAPAGGGGADLVALASDRLAEIQSAIDAAGGVLTPELLEDVESVTTLLEAVAPDDDDDASFDDEDEALAPMSDTEAKAAAKAAWQVGKKTIKCGFKKRTISPEGFAVHCMALARKARTTKNAALRKARLEGLNKMLTFGPELFGSSTDFQQTGSDVPDIPMYTEAYIDSQVDENVKTPTEEPVLANFSYQSAGYTPNENSQQAFDAGSPQLAEKAQAAMTAMRKALGLPVSVAKADAATAEGNGTSETTTEDQTVVDKGRLNTEKDIWTKGYVDALPDSHFLYVEPGMNKDAAGRSTPGEGRHFAYKDAAGNVCPEQLMEHMKSLQNSAFTAKQKDALMAKAEEELAAYEKATKSDLHKADRGDEGWPDDLNTPSFLGGERSVRKRQFGYDQIPQKVEKLRRGKGGDKATQAAAK